MTPAASHAQYQQLIVWCEITIGHTESVILLIMNTDHFMIIEYWLVTWSTYVLKVGSANIK